MAFFVFIKANYYEFKKFIKFQNKYMIKMVKSNFNTDSTSFFVIKKDFLSQIVFL